MHLSFFLTGHLGRFNADNYSTLLCRRAETDCWKRECTLTRRRQLNSFFTYLHTLPPTARGQGPIQSVIRLSGVPRGFLPASSLQAPCMCLVITRTDFIMARTKSVITAQISLTLICSESVVNPRQIEHLLKTQQTCVSTERHTIQKQDKKCRLPFWVTKP